MHNWRYSSANNKGKHKLEKVGKNRRTDTMKVNVDLSSANNIGTGICTFENEIVMRLAQFYGITPVMQ